MVDAARIPIEPALAGSADTVLTVRDLAVHFPVRQGFETRLLKAVDGVSLELKAGECLGLVGESGCGKSTFAQAVMGLLPPTLGQVELVSAGATRQSRARAIQMVFQDPFSALNPRMTIRQTLGGPLQLHRLCPPDQIESRIAEMLVRVGIDPAAMDRYPHAFSGGQRQRLCIARALVVEPRILICDEPVSALDVSIRAQIINLLLSLKDDLGVALVVISHDLGVIEHMSDRIAVMYLGRFVETGRWDEVLTRPAHPYTRALLASMPGKATAAGHGRDERLRLSGEAPSALRPPPGCAFHPRCTMTAEICRSGGGPAFTELSGGHSARCHFANEGDQHHA